MKHVLFVLITASVLALTGCKDQTESAYYDLNKGEDVSLVKDENTGLMVDAETKKPVYIYVNKETKDTIYGATGEVINGHVIKLEDGKYKYDDLKVKMDEDGDFKLKDGDYKRKLEADGDTKTKDDDRKKKVDGETGEVKNK
ncbi:MAG TPA: hypothetical protein VJ111_18345 [Chitinophagaceae bacterium]|nr:hypothetical protein [Chitinophagaceae bacterium]